MELSSSDILIFVFYIYTIYTAIYIYLEYRILVIQGSGYLFKFLYFVFRPVSVFRIFPVSVFCIQSSVCILHLSSVCFLYLVQCMSSVFVQCLYSPSICIPTAILVTRLKVGHIDCNTSDSLQHTINSDNIGLDAYRLSNGVSVSILHSE